MSFFKDVGNHVKRGTKNISKTVKKAKRKVDKATAPIGDAVEDVVDKAVDGSKTAVRKSGNFVKERVEDVGDVVEKIGDSKPVEKLKDAGEAIGDSIKDIGEKIGDSKAVEKLKDAGEFIGDAVEPVARPIGNGVKELGKGIKEFAEDVGEKGLAFIKDKIESSDDFQRTVNAINSHGHIIKALGNTHDLLKDKQVRKEIFDDVVNPIRRDEIRGVDAQRKIEGLGKHPAMAELMQAGEESDYDGWCVSLGGVLDVPGLGVGGQAAGGVLLAPARLYGALSYSLGLAAGVNVDAQVGIWFRKVAAMPGKFYSIEIDLHVPQIALGGLPVGASLTVSFDTDDLLKMGFANVPGSGFLDPVDTTHDHGLQGFVISGGVGLGGELFNRASGYTWVTGT